MSLLRALLRNTELDSESAEDELRWMHQAVQEKHLSREVEGELLHEMVQLRAGGMPLQYILGDTEFGPLQLRCRPPTLIPRPETAFVFERFALTIAAHSANTDQLKLLDLYTGSAPIPLLMRHLLPDNWRTFGVDLSEKAVALAKDNVEFVSRQFPTSKPATQIWQADIMRRSFSSSTMAKLNGKCHILTANPPYIPYDQYVNLPHGVRVFEDVNALLGDGGPTSPLIERQGDGLSHYRWIACLIPELLVEKENMAGTGLISAPRIALEIGWDQGVAVQEILINANAGVSRTECWKDQWEQDRLVVAWL